MHALKGQQRIAQGNTLGVISNTSYVFLGQKCSSMSHKLSINYYLGFGQKWSSMSHKFS